MGRGKKHQSAMSVKSERSNSAIRKAKYKFKDIPINLLNQIFDTLVQPISLYGAEIWADKMDKKIVDKAGVANCERILGVGQEAANCGTMIEAGRVFTSAPAIERLIIYWIKLKRY